MVYKEVLRGTVAIALAATVAACNLGKSPEPTADVNALYTAAAETLISQLGDQQTQTAAAVSPTPLVSPTSQASVAAPPTFQILAGLTPGATTLTAGTAGAPLAPAPTSPPAGGVAGGFAVGCDNATLIGETVLDGTEEKGLQTFEKSWTFLNSGTCTWDKGYTFAFKSGDQLGGGTVRINLDSEFIAPGKSQTFAIDMTAPKKAAEYKGYWQMKNDTGVWFGSLVWVDIIVK